MGGAAAGEFPAEWFVGGDARLPMMAGLEGKPAPAFHAGTWIGEPVEPSMREGRVTVVRFVSPLSKDTRASMSQWKKTSEKLGSQGVVFMGICDHLAHWERMKSLVDEGALPFPIARDTAPEEGALPLGLTATAYGVRMWPTTVVIDRSGRVRAAGIEEERLQAVLEKLMAEPLDRGGNTGN